MSESTCRCGHDVFIHSEKCNADGCVCTLGYQAAWYLVMKHRDQRAAAIAHLREITGKRKKFKRPSVGWNRLDNELWTAVEAYRAVGILKGPKP